MRMSERVHLLENFEFSVKYLTLNFREFWDIVLNVFT